MTWLNQNTLRKQWLSLLILEVHNEVWIENYDLDAEFSTVNGTIFMLLSPTVYRPLWQDDYNINPVQGWFDEMQLSRTHNESVKSNATTPD